MVVVTRDAAAAVIFALPCFHGTVGDSRAVCMRINVRRLQKPGHTNVLLPLGDVFHLHRKLNLFLLDSQHMTTQRTTDSVCRALDGA